MYKRMTTSQTVNERGLKLGTVFLPSHLSLWILNTIVAKVGVFEWSGTVGSSL